MKKNNLIMVLIIAFSAVVFIVPAVRISSVLAAEKEKKSKSGNKKYELKYSMPKGTRFLISGITENSIDNEIQDTKINSVIKREYEYSFEVISINDEGNMEMEVVYKKMNRNEQNPQGNVDTDYSKLLSKKVKIALASNGEVSGFEGFENLPVVALPMQGENDADDYKRFIEVLFPAMPDNPVSIGENWSFEKTRKRETGENHVVNITTNYTYNFVEETMIDGIECLKIKVEMLSTDKGEQVQGGMVGILDIEEEGKRTIFFAYKKGMILKIEGSSIEDGNVVVKDMGVTVLISAEASFTRTVKFE